MFPPQSQVSESAIEAKLSETKNFPTSVVNWEVSHDFDYDGDESIHVLATVDDDNDKDNDTKFDKRIKTFSMIHELVTEEVFPQKVFVYVDLHSPSDKEEQEKIEQEELEQEKLEA